MRVCKLIINLSLILAISYKCNSQTVLPEERPFKYLKQGEDYVVREDFDFSLLNGEWEIYADELSSTADEENDLGKHYNKVFRFNNGNVYQAISDTNFINMNFAAFLISSYTHNMNYKLPQYTPDSKFLNMDTYNGFSGYIYIYIYNEQQNTVYLSNNYFNHLPYMQYVPSRDELVYYDWDVYYYMRRK